MTPEEQATVDAVTAKLTDYDAYVVRRTGQQSWAIFQERPGSPIRMSVDFNDQQDAENIARRWNNGQLHL